VTGVQTCALPIYGFLAFSEIHPDYYQIPVADRQALLDEEARSHREEEDDPKGDRRSRRHRRPRQSESEMRSQSDEHVSEIATPHEPHAESDAATFASGEGEAAFAGESESGNARAQAPARDSLGNEAPSADETPKSDQHETAIEAAPQPHQPLGAGDAEVSSEGRHDAAPEAATGDNGDEDDDEPEVTTLDGGAEERAPRSRGPRNDDEGEPVEHVGGDAMEEVPRRAQRMRRQYKIQEVIKRRQILLVQVVKEERGNKGAALTTYLSLAGRYSVLMPNTARGGGISRKITNSLDRSRLKSIAEELEVPEGMGVILRTAGAARTKAEVKRDFEYLLRMWETVRELTLSSSAPTLVYEEGSLIKRAIRDLYNRDVEEIVVAGEAGYREAREFMRLLMPSHAKNVQLYRDVQPVFAKSGVEAQLDAMFSNQVTLKSGGYIVINQTEALVAIDVNSGRSTREHNIEDTAVRTNLEAADEVARQLRLRDLAGLIVVDFIDMEEGRNNRAVERRIKDALKNDRARIQVGRISHFGLLEMSRQRIRTGVLEGSTVICPHCAGAGVVRSTSSVALHVLRVVEDALIKSASHDIIVRARTEVALYILNQKRAHLRDLERRFGVNVTVGADELESSERTERPAPRRTTHGEPAGEEGDGGRRRRRRRRRRGGERGPSDASLTSDSPQPTDAGLEILAEIGGDLPAHATGMDEAAEAGAVEPRARERSRRPRRGREHAAPMAPIEAEAAPADEPSQDMFASSDPVDLPLMRFATEQQPVEAATPSEPAHGDAKAESAATKPATPEAPTSKASPADDPSRPRRSGWWQRAKASIVGE
jgi:ribonuclease E